MASFYFAKDSSYLSSRRDKERRAQDTNIIAMVKCPRSASSTYRPHDYSDSYRDYARSSYNGMPLCSIQQIPTYRTRRALNFYEQQYLPYSSHHEYPLHHQPAGYDHGNFNPSLFKVSNYILDESSNLRGMKLELLNKSYVPNRSRRYGQ